MNNFFSLRRVSIEKKSLRNFTKLIKKKERKKKKKKKKEEKRGTFPITLFEILFFVRVLCKYLSSSQ